MVTYQKENIINMETKNFAGVGEHVLRNNVAEERK